MRPAFVAALCLISVASHAAPPSTADVVLGALRKEMARAKASAADINARLMDGFTDAEIDVVSRWLRAVQTKFPKGDKP